jgi:hypothetical protein
VHQAAAEQPAAEPQKRQRSLADVVNGPSLPPRRRRPSKKKRRRKAMLLGLLICAVLGLCGGVGTLAFRLIFVSEVEVPMTDADMQFLPTAQQFAAKVNGLRATPGLERYRKVHQRYGREVSYIYGNPGQGQNGFYLGCFAIILPSEWDAKSKYLRASTYLEVGPDWPGKSDLTRQDMPQPYHWGNESQCYLLLQGREVIGRSFTARKGKRVFHLVIIGPRVTGEILKEVLDPVLARLEEFNG